MSHSGSCSLWSVLVLLASLGGVALVQAQGAPSASDFVLIKAGVFAMGSPEDEPGRFTDERRHEVLLRRDFHMQATEVTQGQWLAVMDTKPSYFSTCGDACPVERVTWWEALAYANALSRKEGLEACYDLGACTGDLGGGCPASENEGRWCRDAFSCSSVTFKGLDCEGYRLPTEAEWEYAARAGTTGRHHDGKSSPDAVAWYKENAGDRTHQVAQKEANHWGLYDMHGNVWEWVWDRSNSYPSLKITDPIGAASGVGRAVRGGSWSSEADGVRAASRYAFPPGDRIIAIGFRLCRSIPLQNPRAAPALDFVRIEKGAFTMGSPEDEPDRDDDETQHEVVLTRDFYLQATELTQWQWRSLMGDTNPDYASSCGDACPATGVTWWDAVAYANALSKAEGLASCYVLSACDGSPGDGHYACAEIAWPEGLDCTGYRLPTEAEWEYAARAGTTGPYHDGAPKPDAVAWYGDNSVGVTRGVAQKQANAWGLYDMHGNQSEWVWDWYGPYPTTKTTDPTGAPRGTWRVKRGGSWFDDADELRVALRAWSVPGRLSPGLGFRLCRSVPQSH